MDEWITFFREAQAYPWVLALEVIGVSAVAAKIVDLVISRFLLRLTLRTNTDLDDRLVQLLHRPVFLSVILVGLYIAVETLDTRPRGIQGRPQRYDDSSPRSGDEPQPRLDSVLHRRPVSEALRHHTFVEVGVNAHGGR